MDTKACLWRCDAHENEERQHQYADVALLDPHIVDFDHQTNGDRATSSFAWRLDVPAVFANLPPSIPNPLPLAANRPRTDEAPEVSFATA